MQLDTSSAQAWEHARDLRAEAAQTSLAHLATCCRCAAGRALPARAVQAVVRWYRHGQLDGGRALPCCPWPV